MVDNVTSISIALAVNERVIGSRHENLAIVLLLLALPSFYRKILIQPTGCWCSHLGVGAQAIRRFISQAIRERE